MKKFVLLLLLPFTTWAQTKLITLEDVYKKGTFRPETVAGFSSMKDGRYYTESDKEGNILQKSFVTGETISTLINSSDVKDDKGIVLGLKDFTWSDDETKLLVYKERENIYRRSSKAITYSYDIATKKIVKIDDAKIMHATYSPDGNKVAFVKDNNLFIKDIATNKTTQITKDGKWNFIINGNADWVYEEEFSLSRAFQWSKKGSYLAYYKFDESKVKEYTMAYYDSLYPRQYAYKYPKAGEANSIIEIHIYNLATKKDVKADIGKETDIYIPRIKFTQDDTRLSITCLNRLQNDMQLLMADAATGKTKMYHQEKNKYYVEMENGNVTFLEDGKHFAYTSNKDGYTHIYLKTIDGSKEIQITKGNFDVADLMEIDEKNNIIYFTAAYNSPKTRSLLSVDMQGKNMTPILNDAGTHAIRFNKNFTYFMDTYSGADFPPQISIYETKTVQQIRLLKDNAKLIALMKDYGFATPAFIKVPTSKGDILNGWMLKPKDFDETKKYPVLFCNYGGPGSQQVANRWGAVSAWHQYFVQHGIIVVCVDNTGTGFRGEEFKKKTYLQLGRLEIEDQIDAAKHLATLPYIDAKRIGHYGWSFGGFMSSLAITKGAGTFSMAVAGAPVTSWRYYDNIYTERYMRTPQENKQGYDDNAPMNFVKNIKGKFLIVHGTADDNVHFQNSVMMVNELIKNNIDFESTYYPNKAHSFQGDNSEFHKSSKITKFILDNL